MRGIYIPGMEMPTTPVLFCIHPDGKVFADLEGGWREYQAIPVPDHGDLVDRKPFVEFIKTHWDSYDQWFVGQLEARPTIIPADKEEEG